MMSKAEEVEGIEEADVVEGVGEIEEVIVVDVVDRSDGANDIDGIGNAVELIKRDSCELLVAISTDLRASDVTTTKVMEVMDSS